MTMREVLLAVMLGLALLTQLPVPNASADNGDAFGAWSNSERRNVFRVSPTGDLLPTTTNSADLGADTMRYRALYTAGAIYDSDAVVCQTAGKGLQLKEGSNAVMGVATLSSGAVTVSTTAVTSSSRIFVSGQTSAGACFVVSRVAGTSFTIHSTSGSDSGTVAWQIIQPSP